MITSSETIRSADRYPFFWERRPEPFSRAHLERVQAESLPRSSVSKILEGNCVAIDCMSMTRNSLSAGAMIKEGAEGAAKVASAVGGLAIAGGAMGVVAGLNIVRVQGAKLLRDFQLGNWEGGFDHTANGLMGASYVGLSGALVVSGASTFAGASAAAAASALAITGAGLAMYGLIGLSSGYGLAAAGSFRSDLSGILQDGKNSRRLSTALLWLASQLREGKTDAELQAKWDQFAFRTSEAAGRLVREQVTPELLRRIDAGDLQAIEQGKQIAQEVKRANAKQLLKQAILIAIAAIGIASFVCGLVLSGPFSPILFAVGALLWIAVDSSKAHEKLGDLFFGKSKIPALL